MEGRNIKPPCVYTSNSKSINIKMNLFSIYDNNIIDIETIFINWLGSQNVLFNISYRTSFVGVNLSIIWGHKCWVARSFNHIYTCFQNCVLDLKYMKIVLSLYIYHLTCLFNVFYMFIYAWDSTIAIYHLILSYLSGYNLAYPYLIGTCTYFFVKASRNDWCI